MSVSPRYQAVLDCVTETPSTATEIYRRWAGIAQWKSLTRRHRNERAWIGKALENLAADGLVVRERADHAFTFKL